MGKHESKVPTAIAFLLMLLAFAIILTQPTYRTSLLELINNVIKLGVDFLSWLVDSLLDWLSRWSL